MCSEGIPCAEATWPWAMMGPKSFSLTVTKIGAVPWYSKGPLYLPSYQRSCVGRARTVSSKHQSSNIATFLLSKPRAPKGPTLRRRLDMCRFRRKGLYTTKAANERNRRNVCTAAIPQQHLCRSCPRKWRSRSKLRGLSASTNPHKSKRLLLQSSVGKVSSHNMHLDGHLEAKKHTAVGLAPSGIVQDAQVRTVLVIAKTSNQAVLLAAMPFLDSWI